MSINFFRFLFQSHVELLKKNKIPLFGYEKIINLNNSRTLQDKNLKKHMDIKDGMINNP